ncbi:DUF4440 domain-containing protein [Sphingomonas sp.]|uniref:YybH family protein n=1 Tax=Sphingomonas sp. TaxID=28214 RepID=UPI001B127747|nr:DUF4440 domain-containing protein [Sphingomonas sp.]MBO9714960.1 DUF4440 domain-containing protein [Sphingomonas sp.]
MTHVANGMIALAALAMTLTACTPAAPTADKPAGAPSSAADTEAVKAADAALLAAYQAKDAAKLKALYAEDAEVFTPFAPVHHQSDAGSDFKDPAFKLDYRTARAETSGDLGFTNGSFTVSFTNPETRKVETMTGSYVTVFRKGADGSWKVVQDIATPGPAPTAAPTAG